MLRNAMRRLPFCFNIFIDCNYGFIVYCDDALLRLHILQNIPLNWACTLFSGQKKYVCTRCSAMYESPNPLKLHVTLACGAQTISWLWNRLSNLICGSISRSCSVNEFSFNLLSDPQVTKQRNAIDLSVMTSNLSESSTSKLHRPFLETHNSAFKPFQKRNPRNSNNFSLDQRCVYQQWPHFSTTEDFVSTPVKLEHTYEDEAQIETLVSSLGKSKHGHICLYCGKRYSRKYGLKIHIRTHTGYKPLKCKYCLRPFGDPSNLNKHVRLHAAGDTPYK